MIGNHPKTSTRNLLQFQRMQPISLFVNMKSTKLGWIPSENRRDLRSGTKGVDQSWTYERITKGMLEK